MCSVQIALILRAVYREGCTITIQCFHRSLSTREDGNASSDSAQRRFRGSARSPNILRVSLQTTPVFSQSSFITNDSIQRIILCAHHLLQETYYCGSELLFWLRDESNRVTSFVLQFETVEHKTGRERKQSREGIQMEGNAQMQTR